MLADTTTEQFQEWIAYHQLEPWGDEWVQTATIASAAANAGGAKTSPLDYLPDQAERIAGLSDDEMQEKYAAKYGAK